MKPEPTISTILIGVHNYLVAKERNANKHRTHPVKKKKPLEIPNSFGYKVILSAEEQEELLELAYASPENEAKSRLFVWFKNWRIRNKHDWKPNSGLPGPTYQNIKLSEGFCKLNGIELNHTSNVNHCQRPKDSPGNESESFFRWWMIFSFLIYAVSLCVIMANDYNSDGHFLMSVSSTGLSAGESIGPSVIHWILFVLIALFGAICATPLHPLIGIVIIPGPLWLLYDLINFILLIVSNLLWSIIEFVFYILFGWMQYVG